jgi:hypothetical protein
MLSSRELKQLEALRWRRVTRRSVRPAAGREVKCADHAPVSQTIYEHQVILS